MSAFEYLEKVPPQLLIDLKAKVEDRNRIRKEKVSLEESRARLNQIIAAEAEIAKELTKIAGAEAEELLLWAEAGNGPFPLGKARERDALERKRREAQDSADAAREAQKASILWSEAIIPRVRDSQAAVNVATLPVVQAAFENSYERLAEAVATQDREIIVAKGFVRFCFNMSEALRPLDYETSRQFAQAAVAAETRIRSLAAPEPAGDPAPWHESVEALVEGGK